MAKWYYFNDDGEKVGPVRGRDLKQLVLEGAVTQNTRVEDENGQIALARNVTGLPFHKAAKPDAAPSEPSTVMLPPVSRAKNGVKSTAENLGEQDFAQLREDFERLQKQQDQQQATKPAALNPFTASMPVAENPFAASMPVAVNPFASPIPEVHVAMPQGERVVRVSIIVRIWCAWWAMVASMTRSLMSITSSAVAFVLVLLLSGVVVIVLLNLFYVTQPGFVPPRWLEPIILLTQQDADENGNSVTPAVEQEAE